MKSGSAGRRPEAPERTPRRAEPTDSVARGPQTVDELSQASFPASDPPPAWTWEIDRRSGRGPRSPARQ